MKILVSGDIHMGRTSSRLGAAASLGDDAHSAVNAWRRLVEVAVEESVGAVCLTGDIIDGSHAFWETTGAFRVGIERLADAGIRTLAIAGNHDWQVLARLSADLPGDSFQLVGRGGKWERVTLMHGDGRPAVHIDGWSFPSRRVTSDPTGTRNLPDDPAVPVLAMVHGDLDVPNSPYAPLSRERLRGHGVAGWMLGHIHAPLLEEGPPFLLYPGSPQALDPSETGSHGVWLVDVEDGRVHTPRRVQLSSVVYAAPEYDVSSWSDFLVDAKAAIVQTAQALGDEHPSARVVSVRPVFKGRTALKQAIPHEISEIDRFTDSVNRVEVLVNRSFDQTAPVLDLEALASRPGAPGELARLILALEGRALPPGAAAPDVEALVHRARRAAGMTTDGDDTAVRQMVRDTSMDLLDRLIA